MSSIKQRTKNKSIKIKCSREKRKEMLRTGRYTQAYSLLTEEHDIFNCPVYVLHQCYWSKSKYV